MFLEEAALLHFTTGRIEDQNAIFEAAAIPIKHAVDGARDGIEGAAANALAAEPVILDEMNGRGQVGGGVIDEVTLGEGRNDDVWQTRTVAAAALRVCVSGSNAGKSLGGAGGAAETVAALLIGGGCGLIDDRAHLVVVPTVRV